MKVNWTGPAVLVGVLLGLGLGLLVSQRYHVTSLRDPETGFTLLIRSDRFTGETWHTILLPGSRGEWLTVLEGE